jgi:hypothetical protein
MAISAVDRTPASHYDDLIRYSNGSWRQHLSVIRGLIRSLRRRVLLSIYPRWPRANAFEKGYAILLPMPGDMPFLLHYALEALRDLDTTH